MISVSSSVGVTVAVAEGDDDDCFSVAGYCLTYPRGCELVITSRVYIWNNILCYKDLEPGRMGSDRKKGKGVGGAEKKNAKLYDGKQVRSRRSRLLLNGGFMPQDSLEGFGSEISLVPCLSALTS